ncbi:hypothetical protein BOX15_Mlig007856g3 [Macrostomum lignano]|uniref:Uncharacterized protein n=2 Tax=Macrostomum lignano TaxID=282301 RepID=A0A267FQ33_9PLAT|nr:hypothetical protein BOX15_Mlig007856g3 [Macrostomum lignano]
MALHVPRAPGFYSMMKEGARHYAGMDEAVFRNIEACCQMSGMTSTCYGPVGMNKIVINHIGKHFITKDAATVLQELEVAHPAAKMLVLSSKQQEQEAGDGTNLCLMLAGFLLKEAESVLRMGLSPTEVVAGYEKALEMAQKMLEDQIVGQVSDVRDIAQVEPLIRCAVMSKQFGLHERLARLISEACISVLPQGGHFDVDRVRVCKVLGGSVDGSRLIGGMVFRRAAEGDVTQVIPESGRVKVAVFACPVDFLQTETKGTVLMETAAELANFSVEEERIMEAQVRSLAEAGARVVVSGGKVGELALHYLNHYNILALRVSSKFDLRRLATATGAIALPRLTTPTAEEMGSCSRVVTQEVGDTNVVVFEEDNCKISTVLLRASTENLLDDLERAVDDGVNAYKALTRNPRFVSGGGATEAALAVKLAAAAEAEPGLEQYAISRFANALDAVVKTLATNCCLNGAETLSKIHAELAAGRKHIGIFCDPDSGESAVANVSERGLSDLLLVKQWALRLACRSACTVLSVDEIIMSRPAGGPKPRGPGGDDDD